MAMTRGTKIVITGVVATALLALAGVACAGSAVRHASGGAVRIEVHEQNGEDVRIAVPGFVVGLAIALAPDEALADALDEARPWLGVARLAAEELGKAGDFNREKNQSSWQFCVDWGQKLAFHGEKVFTGNCQQPFRHCGLVAAAAQPCVGDNADGSVNQRRESKRAGQPCQRRAADIGGADQSADHAGDSALAAAPRGNETKDFLLRRVGRE